MKVIRTVCYLLKISLIWIKYFNYLIFNSSQKNEQKQEEKKMRGKMNILIWKHLFLVYEKKAQGLLCILAKRIILENYSEIKANNKQIMLKRNIRHKY